MLILLWRVSAARRICLQGLPGQPAGAVRHRQCLLRPGLFRNACACFFSSCPHPACALHTAVFRGISHGDVYAHNVMADEEGRATLCDYGGWVSDSLPCPPSLSHWGWQPLPCPPPLRLTAAALPFPWGQAVDLRCTFFCFVAGHATPL